MKWEATIKAVSNGFVVTYRTDEVQQKGYTEKDENDETNRDHVIEMFYDLLDFFAQSGSKHDKKRVRIVYE